MVETWLAILTGASRSNFRFLAKPKCPSDTTIFRLFRLDFSKVAFTLTCLRTTETFRQIYIKFDTVVGRNKGTLKISGMNR